MTKEIKVKKILPSILEPPQLDLKPLPSHLIYAYLRDGDKLLIIVSSKLSCIEESLLLDMVRKNIRVIGWTLGDIPGISPYTCTHRIMLDENAKAIR